MVRKCLLVAAAVLGLSACSTLGESLGRCAFGGATPEEDAYCAAVNFGSEGAPDAEAFAAECTAHDGESGEGSAEGPLSAFFCPSFPPGDVGYAVMSP